MTYRKRLNQNMQIANTKILSTYHIVSYPHGFTTKHVRISAVPSENYTRINDENEKVTWNIEGKGLPSLGQNAKVEHTYTITPILMWTNLSIDRQTCAGLIS